jgi:hypothetical protein
VFLRLRVRSLSFLSSKCDKFSIHCASGAFSMVTVDRGWGRHSSYRRHSEYSLSLVPLLWARDNVYFLARNSNTGEGIWPKKQSF